MIDWFAAFVLILWVPSLAAVSVGPLMKGRLPQPLRAHRGGYGRMDIEFLDSMVKDLRMQRVRLYKEIREIEQSIKELQDNKEKMLARPVRAK